jgi:hypothetical protein
LNLLSLLIRVGCCYFVRSEISRTFLSCHDLSVSCIGFGLAETDITIAFKVAFNCICSCCLHILLLTELAGSWAGLTIACGIVTETQYIG